MFYTKRGRKLDRAPSKSSYKFDRFASRTAKIVERFDHNKGYGWVKWDGNFWRAKISSLSCWKVGEEVVVVRIGNDNILHVKALQLVESRLL